MRGSKALPLAYSTLATDTLARILQCATQLVRGLFLRNGAGILGASALAKNLLQASGPHGDLLTTATSGAGSRHGIVPCLKISKRLTTDCGERLPPFIRRGELLTRPRPTPNLSLNLGCQA